METAKRDWRLRRQPWYTPVSVTKLLGKEEAEAKRMSRVKCGIIEVIEAFGAGDVCYWYYDVARGLKSVNGRRGEAPSLPMNTREIEWVKSKYVTEEVVE